MFHCLKKAGLLVATLLVAIFAVFVFLQITRASAANVLETEKPMSISSSQQVSANLPGVGGWILVPNSVTSSLFVVNSSNNIAYGPFLEGELGSVGGGRFDVEVTPDGMTALISNFGDNTVYIVDVADPIHPSFIATVTVPMFAEDMDISPDGKYALVTDGGFSSIVASIDIMSATLVYTANLGAGQAQAVAIAPDGTVIVADYWNRAIHTLLLEDMGVVITNVNTYTYTYPGYVITDTEGWPRPINVGLAPDGQTVIVCDATTSTIGVYQILSPGVLTFTGVITGLHGTFPIDEFFSPGIQSVAFNAIGDKAYTVVNNMVYSATAYMDRLAVLNIDGPGQVSLEAGGVVSVPHHTGSQLFGVDTVAVAGNKVFMGYPSLSTPDETANLAVVDLTDYSVTSTLVLSKEDFIPTGVSVVPIHLDMSKSVSDLTPFPGQLVTFTLVLTNAGPQVTGVTIRDVMSPELQFVGPVTLYPPNAGVVGSAPPELVTSLVISAYQQVTVTFPVMVLPSTYGDQVLNTAWAESLELSQPARADATLIVELYKVLFPMMLNLISP